MVKMFILVIRALWLLSLLAIVTSILNRYIRKSSQSFQYPLQKSLGTELQSGSQSIDMNTNMDMEVFVMARKCGVKVNHMDDVPRLIEAFNAFGWFAKAKQYGEWYDDM